MAKSKMNEEKKRSHGPRGLRPFWSGTLTFGLVNVPVHLYPGQKNVDVSLRLLAPDGTPLARKYRCPKHGVDVHPEHLVRGFELDSGEYVVVRDEELEAAAPEKSREIDLRQFVAIDEVPPRLFERSYFLTPAGDSNKAYRLLAGAMEKTGLIGIATFVMRGREYLVAVLSESGILRAQTLRFADELKSPEDIGLPEVVEAAAGDIRPFTGVIKELAQEGLEGLDLKDHYAERVKALIAKKQKSRRNIVRIEQADSDDSDDDGGDREADAGIDLLETIRRGLRPTKAPRERDGRPKPSGRPAPKAALGDLSKDQLYERAQRLKIPGRSAMSKKALAQAIAKRG
jgi:DNA end-binding protein Ku